VNQSVAKLLAEKHPLFVSNQNIAEFYNVATRPLVSNGLELPAAVATNAFANIVEPICGILLEQLSLYSELKRLVVQYNVGGKQVHDARLVAIMRRWNVDKILTLNDRDFRRYEPEGIAAVTPTQLLAM
jgi:predicted nucleic acid-binding protein